MQKKHTYGGIYFCKKESKNITQLNIHNILYTTHNTQYTIHYTQYTLLYPQTFFPIDFQYTSRMPPVSLRTLSRAFKWLRSIKIPFQKKSLYEALRTSYSEVSLKEYSYFFKVWDFRGNLLFFHWLYNQKNFPLPNMKMCPSLELSSI